MDRTKGGRARRSNLGQMLKPIVYLLIWAAAAVLLIHFLCQGCFCDCAAVHYLELGGALALFFVPILLMANNRFLFYSSKLNAAISTLVYLIIAAVLVALSWVGLDLAMTGSSRFHQGSDAEGEDVPPSVDTATQNAAREDPRTLQDRECQVATTPDGGVAGQQVVYNLVECRSQHPAGEAAQGAQHATLAKEKEAVSGTYQILGMLLAFVSIVIALGAFLLNRRMEKVDKLSSMVEEVNRLLGYSSSLVAMNLPSYGTSQHIPLSDYMALKGMNDLHKESPYFKERLREEPGEAVRFHFTRALFRFANAEHAPCVRELDAASDILRQEKPTEVEPELEMLTEWRRGISWLAHTNNLEKARDVFKDLIDNSGSDSSSEVGALGQLLVAVAARKREPGRSPALEIDDNDLKILEKAEKYNDYIKWYLFQYVNLGGSIPARMGAFANRVRSPESAESIHSFLVEGHKAEHDYAVRANYAMSLLVFFMDLKRKYPHWLKGEGKWNGLDVKKERRRWEERARLDAEKVQRYNSDYNLVPSERELRRVSADRFLKNLDSFHTEADRLFDDGSD